MTKMQHGCEWCILISGNIAEFRCPQVQGHGLRIIGVIRLDYEFQHDARFS